jgi:hypothetical protein
MIAAGEKISIPASRGNDHFLCNLPRACGATSKSPETRRTPAQRVARDGATPLSTPARGSHPTDLPPEGKKLLAVPLANLLFWPEAERLSCKHRRYDKGLFVEMQGEVRGSYAGQGKSCRPCEIRSPWQALQQRCYEFAANALPGLYFSGSSLAGGIAKLCTVVAVPYNTAYRAQVFHRGSPA